MKISGITKGKVACFSNTYKILNENYSNLLHENTVVALCSHSGMCQTNERTKTIARQIPLPSASLPRNARHLFNCPRRQRLYGTAHRHDVGVLGTVGWLITPPVFDVVQTKADGVRPRQKWQQSPLLQLVRKDRGVGLTVRANGEACGRVPQGNCESGLCHANRHAGNADAAGQQLVCNGQKSSSLIPNWRRI